MFANQAMDYWGGGNRLIDPRNQMTGSTRTDMLLMHGVERDKLPPAIAAAMQPGMTAQQRAEVFDNMRNNARATEALSQMLGGIRGENNMRRYGPAYNMAQQKGYNIQGPDAQLGQNTMMPVPFDEYYSKKANYKALIDSLPRDLYDANEKVIEQMQTLAPAGVRSMWYNPSFIEGTSSDFFTNRINIYLQRKRENDLYAFV